MKKILILIAVLIVGAFGWYRLQLRALHGEDNAQMITIPAGTSVQGIGAMLEEKDIIRSAIAFRIRARGSEKPLQAGSFLLSPSMNTDAVIDALTGGKEVQMKITIPEGYTVKDIDALIASKGIAATGAVLECARTCPFPSFEFLPKNKDLAKRGGQVEGYLYPDTYFVSTSNFQPQYFIERLLSTFRTRVISEFQADVTASKRTWQEIISMASLIEEETRTSAERAVVSGILWKRYDAKHGLDVDAALRYVLDKPSAAITKNDLQLDSPYNLRRFRGLPPGPITNPSTASIKAALRPESSPYWYYLHGNDGQIRYAVTNDEHNLNKSKYLK